FFWEYAPETFSPMALISCLLIILVVFAFDIISEHIGFKLCIALSILFGFVCSSLMATGVVVYFKEHPDILMKSWTTAILEAISLGVCPTFNLSFHFVLQCWQKRRDETEGGWRELNMEQQAAREKTLRELRLRTLLT
ncbi:hypothetical protein PMAYCL1PPCAC_10850, partial [Pristionchus mayeri]